MEEGEQPPEPRLSRWWYVGHVFLWIVTGLICYLAYRNDRPIQARHHLITSVWLGIVVWFVIPLVLMALVGVADIMSMSEI